MAGLLSGLADLGLGNLENADIFAEEEIRINKKEEKKVVPKIEEKDLVYDRTFECPVCDRNFSAKIMKTGRAKLMGTDQDLRPRYEGIDAVKYDVTMCPNCGYAALTRYFGSMSSGQIRLIKENICRNIKLHTFPAGETYSYEEAIERYKVCLANAVVKHAKASEKAYICLKNAWLLRGYRESLVEAGEGNKSQIEELKQQENAFLKNALNGFLEARQRESFPIAGMDEMTMDYLLAVLAMYFEDYDMAGKLVAGILVSPSANARIKDKARDLKEQIMEIRKKEG